MVDLFFSGPMSMDECIILESALEGFDRYITKIVISDRLSGFETEKRDLTALVKNGTIEIINEGIDIELVFEDEFLLSLEGLSVKCYDSALSIKVYGEDRSK